MNYWPTSFTLKCLISVKKLWIAPSSIHYTAFLSFTDVQQVPIIGHHVQCMVAKPDVHCTHPPNVFTKVDLEWTNFMKLYRLYLEHTYPLNETLW
jgi:hypothetical protein